MWDFTSHCSCIIAPPMGYAARYQLLGNWGEKTPKRFTPMSHVQPHEGTWHYTLVQSLKLVFSSLILCSIFSFLFDVEFYLTHILQCTPLTSTCLYEAPCKIVVIPFCQNYKTSLESQNGISQALQGGFEIEWTGNYEECEKCSGSGGECGVADGKFQCFCKDGCKGMLPS